MNSVRVRHQVESGASTNPFFIFYVSSILRASGKELVKGLSCELHKTSEH